MLETATRFFNGKSERVNPLEKIKPLVEELINSEVSAESIRLAFGQAGVQLADHSIERIIRMRIERQTVNA